MSEQPYGQRKPPFSQRTPPFVDTVRLWKDEAYRKNLSDEERAQFEEESAHIKEASARLPGNPAGAIELSDDELRRAVNRGRTCTEYGSISTTWCDNPRVC